MESMAPVDETFTIYRVGKNVTMFDGNGEQIPSFTSQCILDGLAVILQTQMETHEN